MMDLARNNRERGRWSGHRAAVPEWFRVYTDLERDAEDIRLTEVEVVPGLLQTEAYMRALFEGAPVEAEAAVKTRMERQQLLHGDDPPMLGCILSESCVRRMIGGRAVMAEQIEHLAQLSELPRVRIQLRPFDGEETRGLAQRFILLRIPLPGNAASLELVYCEDWDDARYIDDKPGLRTYDELWGAMQAGALGPVETRSRLRELARQLTEGPGDDHR